MATASSSPRLYQRLPGSLVFRWSSLHLAPDHILQITSLAFTESYRRYFFQDIQAITLNHTVTGKIWNGVWAALAVLFFTLGAAIGDEALLPLSIVGAVWLVPLMINIMLGPTCACYVKTAVQIQRWPSLRRVRRARTVIDRLRPLIAAAQGDMALDEIRLRLQPATVSSYAGPIPPVQ